MIDGGGRTPMNSSSGETVSASTQDQEAVIKKMTAQRAAATAEQIAKQAAEGEEMAARLGKTQVKSLADLAKIIGSGEEKAKRIVNVVSIPGMNKGNPRQIETVGNPSRAVAIPKQLATEPASGSSGDPTKSGPSQVSTGADSDPTAGTDAHVVSGAGETRGVPADGTQEPEEGKNKPELTEQQGVPGGATNNPEASGANGVNEPERDTNPGGSQKSLGIQPPPGDSQQNTAVEQARAAAREEYARKLLTRERISLDPDMTIEQAIANYKREGINITPQHAKILHRLEKAQSLALRHEAQTELDGFQGSKDSDEYKKWKDQLTEVNNAAKRRYVREILQKDKGLQDAIKREWPKNSPKVDFEDFDVDAAIRILESGGKLSNSLRRRLVELRWRGESAVISDKLEIEGESPELLQAWADAGKSVRSSFHRRIDGIGDFCAKMGGPEIEKAWNDGKGYAEVVKQLKKQIKELKHSGGDPKLLENKNQSLQNARNIMVKSFAEAIGKRSGNLIFKFFLMLSVIIISAPLVGPAFAADKLKGMGAKG